MKARAESLDLSLDALKSSFETISQITTSLSQESPSIPAKVGSYDPLVHLPPILELPHELRMLLDKNERNQANLLWGSREVCSRFSMLALSVDDEW